MAIQVSQAETSRGNRYIRCFQDEKMTHEVQKQMNADILKLIEANPDAVHFVALILGQNYKLHMDPKILWEKTGIEKFTQFKVWFLPVGNPSAYDKFFFQIGTQLYDLRNKTFATIEQAEVFVDEMSA